MPMIKVEWLAGRSARQREELAKAITRAFVEIAKVSEDQVWIAFDDVPRTHWAIGGKLVDPGKPQ